MGKITVVGLGPGSPDDLTLRAMREIENAKHLYLRTRLHPTVKYMDHLNVKYKSFDDVYDSEPTFEMVYNKIASELLNCAKNFDIVYAVPGHPLVAEATVQLILKDAKKYGVDVDILPAMSFIDSIVKALSIDPVEGLKVLDGLQLESQIPDANAHNIVTQVYSSRVASEVKIKLMEYYDDETGVVMIRAAGVLGEERLETMPLYNIDRVD